MEHSARTMPAEPVHADRATLLRVSVATREPARAYVPPRLTIFGNLERLTTKVGSQGKKDGQGSRRTGF